MTDFRTLCAELVAVEDALIGKTPVTGNQGQALDGFSALAHFRDIAERARAALAQPELVKPTDKELGEAIRSAVAHTQQHRGSDVWTCDADELLAIADELEGIA